MHNRKRTLPLPLTRKKYSSIVSMLESQKFTSFGDSVWTCGPEEEVEEEGAGKEKGYGEAEDYAVDAKAERKCHQIGGGDSYHYIADESYPEHRHHMRGAPKSVGKCDLCGITELIYNERNYKEQGLRKHSFVCCKKTDKLFC